MHTAIEIALNELKQGRMIIIVDETREKESDLMFAAQFAEAQKIAFMLKHTSGIITVPLTKKRTEELDLPLMVENNSEKHCTNFTVSVDSRDNEMTTGVSAKDRALTIKKIVSGTAAELSRPGHIFPLVARNSLVERHGHTEASVTLCKLAGLQEIAVICELMNEDGTMMDEQQTALFANTHQLKIITIREIIEFVRFMDE